MPKIRHKDTGAVSVVSDQQAADLVRSGRFQLDDGSAVEVRSTTGGKVRVGGRQLGGDKTLTPTTAEEQAETMRRQRLERNYGSGLLNKAKAVGEGFVSTAFFGALDPLLEDEATDARREVLGGYRTAGEIGGVLVPSFLSGGAALGGQGAIRGGGNLARAVARYTPAGAVSRLGGRIAARGGAKAAIAGAAVEGGLGNAGHYLSDVALGNKKLSAEGFVGSITDGAFWGGAAGGAFHGLERGFVHARKMFPRLAGARGKESVEAAEQAFSQQADEVLATGDDTIKAARTRLAQIRADRGEIGLALDQQKLTTRRALDDIKIERAKAGPAPRTRKAPAPELAPAPGVPEPAGAGGWTPGAIDDSGELAAMLGQRPQLAEGSGPIHLERLVAEHDRALADVRGWIARTRGTVAKKSGGVAEAMTPAGVFHGAEGRTARSFDEAGQEVFGEAAIPLERQAWRRPAMRDADGAAITEDYNDLIRRAAFETDDAARQALTREAAELEEMAFEASAEAIDRVTLNARKATGIDALTLAQRRVAREVDNLAKMSPQEAAHYVTGQGPRPAAGRIGASKGDEMFAPWDRELAKHSDSLSGGLAEAEARLARQGVRGTMQRIDDVERAGLDAFDSMRGGETFEGGRLVSSAEEGIKLLGNLERSNADLVRELGEAAPPAARAMADDYGKAVADQSRKTTDRMAQVADDLAEGGGQALVKKGATEAIAETAGRAADVGMIMEMLQTAGVPVPDIDRLPVIGPVLSLFLKVRAARAMVGRLGGRVPATAEARAATKAAAARDKAAQAVDRMLGLGAAAARRATIPAAVAAPRLAALGHKLFDDGQKREAKDVGEQVRHRMDELAAATANPNAVRIAVRRAMRDARDPDLVAAVEEVQLRKIGYLAEHMPKEPPPSLLGRKQWTPSKAEIDRFARRVKAAEDPVSVLEDLANGTITPEAAETLREVYPELFAEAQMRLIERSAEITEELPYQQVVKLALLFDAPLLPSLRPERIAAYQEAAAAQPQPPSVQKVPAPTGPPPNLDSLYMSPADRRAMRR